MDAKEQEKLDAEARSIVSLLAAESGIRVREEDIEVRHVETEPAYQKAYLREDSHTYERLVRIREYKSKI